MRPGGISRLLRNNPPIAKSLVILYAGIIFFVSSMSHPPGVSSGDPLMSLLISLFEHVLEYFVLGFLVCNALIGSGKREKEAVLFTACVCIAYGLTDEIHQLYVPGRLFDLLDVGADALGAYAGALAARKSIF